GGGWGGGGRARGPGSGGSDPGWGSARPAAPSRCARSPYVTPAPTVTAPAAESTSQTAGSPAVATSTPGVSAIGVNECPVPSARTRVLSATMARSPATVRGLRTRTAWNATFPAQLAGPRDRPARVGSTARRLSSGPVPGQREDDHA